MLRAEIVAYLETEAEILEYLEFAVRLATRYYLQHPEIPHPYQLGGRYSNEPWGTEKWLTVKAILRAITRGEPIDCEDWAILLAAWYRARRRIMARVVLSKQKVSRGILYHAVVRLPGGKIVDPSRALGMRG